MLSFFLSPSAGEALHLIPKKVHDDVMLVAGNADLKPFLLAFLVPPVLQFLNSFPLNLADHYFHNKFILKSLQLTPCVSN